jgi:hypothetical protein
VKSKIPALFNEMFINKRSLIARKTSFNISANIDSSSRVRGSFCDAIKYLDMLDAKVARGEVISLFVSDYTLHIVYKTPPILIPVVLPSHVSNP